MVVVEEQAVPYPAFSTVRVPNPEDPVFIVMALELAGRVKADIMLATDPDGDRVGTAARRNSLLPDLISAVVAAHGPTAHLRFLYQARLQAPVIVGICIDT